MDREENQFSKLFPDVAAQLRVGLSNLYLAAAQLAPAEAREQNPDLDAKASLLDQSYYRMLRLVNSLSSAALLTGSAPLQLSDKDIVALISSLCDKASSLAETLGISIHFNCPLPQHICAVSPDALETLVYHLLSNSLKFTPAGGSVTVSLRVKSGHVLLSVTDTGCGISEDHIPTLFDRYLQSGRVESAAHGLGLGLPLCRRIAEAHGGTLVAESKEGSGSRFTFSFPDKKVGGGVSDLPFDYAGGFNRALLCLADALPAKAFLLRNQD